MKVAGQGGRVVAEKPMQGNRGEETRGSPEVILASGSPRRKMIFKALGLRFAAVASGIDEPRWSGEDPEQLVRCVAAAKARAVIERLRLSAAPPWVVGADTIVVADGRVFGQPDDAEDARRMITALSGRTHSVLTAVSVWAGPGEVVSFVESTVVRFRPVGADDIERYLAEGDWQGKAGAYAIQGAAGAFVSAVEGDAWNVVGFPVRAFLDHARAAGIPVPEERAVRPGLARLWPAVEPDEELFSRRWGPRWV